MNVFVTRTLDRLVRKAGARYAQGEMTKDEMIAYRIRVERLRDRCNWLRMQRRNRASLERRIARIASVREVIARGGTLAAFDTEFSNDGPVEQLGIAIWQNGTITTHTYTLPHLLEWYSNRPSLYGQESIVSRTEMKRIAGEVYAAADINVFHSYASDAEKLGLQLNTNRYVDTSRLLSLSITQGSIPGLRDICAYYGIPFDGHHNAGNDAHHTLQALREIAGDTWDDELREEPVIRERREAHRQTMMRPTRLPVLDPEELNQVRQRAQVAYKKFCDSQQRRRKFVKGESTRAERRKSYLASLDNTLTQHEKNRAFRGRPVNPEAI
jgi:hypothetical protein